MGQLIAKRYPTNIAGRMADYTYVVCGTGAKGWACWGGKSGGKSLRSAVGSTRRADSIAEPDEKANIRCYAINGVCHQAANRILFPAQATVRGARGYKISEAIYNTYGRFRGPRGACLAPFHQHANVNGDLPECAVARPHEPPAAAEMEADPERRYLSQVLDVYERRLDLESGNVREGDPQSLPVELFMLMVHHLLGDAVREQALAALLEIRAGEEEERVRIEGSFLGHDMTVGAFVQALNDLGDRFQDNVAKVLSLDDYAALLGVLPGDHVWLVDPDIARAAYPERD